MITKYLKIEVEREKDGRWIAKAVELPAGLSGLWKDTR